MELSDEKVLEALLSDCERRTLKKRSGVRMPVQFLETAYQPPAKHSNSRRCQCGACGQCAENARWDRIFEAKFADPDYYTRPLIVSHGSPLADG
jgi:hypothetical protein